MPTAKSLKQKSEKKTLTIVSKANPTRKLKDFFEKSTKQIIKY